MRILRNFSKDFYWRSEGKIGGGKGWKIGVRHFLIFIDCYLFERRGLVYDGYWVFIGL